MDVLREHSVELILSDINMPSMDGLEFFARCAHSISLRMFRLS
jgi:YesN/AraC family two-component response regulator